MISHATIVQHPLDKFSFTGKMESLDSTGRKAADQLLTMIGDFRFLKDDIRGTCAGYFLLVDLLWFPHLCFLANINCEKLRDYLWRGEGRNWKDSQKLFDDAQTALPFLANEGQVTTSSACTYPKAPDADLPTGRVVRFVGQLSNNDSRQSRAIKTEGSAA
jgi:hypothetical protein